MTEKTFEQSMNRLEEIIKTLEDGGGTLEEMISLYEEGMHLHDACVKKLDAYEGKLTKLNLVHKEA